MGTRSWVLFGSALLAAGGLVAACSSAGSGAPSAELSAGSAGGEAGEAGAHLVESGGDAGAAGAALAGADAGDSGAAGAPAAELPPACEPTSRTDAPDDGFEDSNCDGIDGNKSTAIFVSPDGSDKSSGEFGSPVSTISKGVELASAQGKDVYVCTADYAENVVVDTKRVSIFGGYECADWSRGNTHPNVVPTSGIALKLRKVSAVTIDRMNFMAAAAKAPGDSAIAAQVMASDHIVLSHLELTAGNGASGANAIRVATVTKAARSGTDGDSGLTCNEYLDICDADSVAGGDGPTDKCGSTKMHGGAGGNGAPHPKGKPDPGAAGTPGTKKSGAAGKNGATGKSGTFSNDSFGSVTGDGYVASNAGTDGLDGAPGESGGGGDGGDSCHYESFPLDVLADCIAGVGQEQFFYGSGGGQGGYGGCSGQGGYGGGAGGASIALLSINSSVALSWSSLSTAKGGDGGLPSAGAKGQPGGDGGRAGKPSSSALGIYANQTKGQDGGVGGDGGPGGNGGPGGGGPSITVVALGDAPLTQAVTFTNGAGGKGATGLNGQDAVSGESMELKVIDTASTADGS